MNKKDEYIIFINNEYFFNEKGEDVNEYAISKQISSSNV